LVFRFKWMTDRDRWDGTATAELPYRTPRLRMKKTSDSTPCFGALLDFVDLPVKRTTRARRHNFDPIEVFF
jgi:hypothetical protein